MSVQSQDPVSKIENALITMRRNQRRRHQQRDPGSRRHDPRDHSLGGAARFRMLNALAAAGGMSISDIAQAVGVDQPRASRLVNESLEHGYVHRTADPTDGRRSVIELSATGRRIREAAHESRRSAVTGAMSDFSPEEVETFANLLERFVEGWSRD